MSMSSNKEKLMDLLNDRAELLPLIHDVLAEHHITEASYAHIFRVLYSTMADDSDEVAYCSVTKEWKCGKKTLSDIKVFNLLGQVCDIVRYYVRMSWDECIFSAWLPDQELMKVEQSMTSMEGLSHVRGILKIAAANMVYSSDGTMDWTANGAGECATAEG